MRVENRTYLNNATVYKHALAVKSQIEKSFSGYDKNTNTEYRTNVTFDKNEKNYVMAFTSEVKKKEGNVIYTTQTAGRTDKIGDVKNNTMQVRLGAKSIENQETTETETESGRTGAHEYGHSLGLLHPTGDPTGSPDAVETTTSSPENLMRQSQYFEGEPGTEITNKQLEKARIIVEEQQNL